MKFHVEISKSMHFVIEAESKKELQEALDQDDFDGWGCDDWDVSVGGEARGNCDIDMGVSGGRVLALDDYKKRRIGIQPATPVGLQKAWAFVERERSVGVSGLEVIEVPAFPHSPQGLKLREAREAAGLSIGEAARLAGCAVSAWSGLERGSHVAENWDAAFALLKRKD